MSDDDSDLVKALGKLSAREVKVLKERFGSDFEEHPELQKIARQFHVTRERIRRIEERARRKLPRDGSDQDDDA